MFNGLENVRTYIDGLFLISNKSFEEYINKLDKVMNELKQKDFKINVEKSLFARNKLGYRVFRITRQGLMPLPDKV